LISAAFLPIAFFGSDPGHERISHHDGTELAQPSYSNRLIHHIMFKSPLASEPVSPAFQSRRSVLGTLGVGSLALLGSASPAAAFFGRRSDSAAVIDLSGLPPEWVARQGSALNDYVKFLKSQRLQRLTPLQVIEAHAKHRGTVWNTLPPRSLWRQMVPTLHVIDRISMELGQPVKEIISAYRAPAYNARCSGARRGSWHQANVAVDVIFPVRPTVVAQTARSLRTRGLFQGGVGRYSSFTHVDTRGQNVDW
jgi:hypothetical protein